MDELRGDDPISPPSRLLLSSEGGRALIEFASTMLAWPLLRRAPRGDGHAVLVLPGLMADDSSTRTLRDYLADRGYDPHGWGQGRNRGPHDGVVEGMLAQLHKLADASGRKVSVVGWSLGGTYAHRLAAACPEAVRCVVTLGSRLAGSGRASNAWQLYEAVSGRKASAHGTGGPAATLPMPTTSIYSRSDGVVAWQASVLKSGPHTENIEVVASHVGMGANPAVLFALADRLAQPEDDWKPFDRRRFDARVYPEPARCVD